MPGTGAGISYSRELHGSHREFCAGPFFEQYREEMRVLLDTLSEFAAQGESMDQARKITEGFNGLFRKRFNATCREGYAELIDGPGKRTLENICALLRDGTIPLHIRKSAAVNLSASLGVCEGGTLSNLIATERGLLMSAGGIKARFWKMKEDCTRGVLQEAVQEKFGQRTSYTDYEIHYVNGVWNALADEIGLEPVTDPGAPALRVQEPAFVDACRTKVLNAITPDNLAGLLAEQCLSAFRNAAPPEQHGVEYGQGMPAWFDAALDNILLDLRLGAERLTLHAFVQLDEFAERYRLRTDATLIAVALLDAIHAEGLMDDIPVQRAEWRDERGQRAVALAYGRLAWQSSRAETATAHWKSPDLLTMADLHRWREARGPGTAEMSPIEVRAAIRADDPQALRDTPAECLVDADTVLLLLARLGDDEACRYLNRHIGYFRDHFPHGERAALIDGVMHMGNVGFVLASNWYPDMYALLGEVSLTGGATRLQRWMAQRNVAAIDAVRLLAEQGWAGAAPVQRKGHLLYRLLCGKDDTPMLYDAMVADNAAGIGAWHRLVCSPAVLPSIGALLPDLLIADRKGGVAALTAAMHRDRARAVGAYHALLADPAILPKIRRRLPGLLAGTSTRFGRSLPRGSPLVYAMDGGSAAAILAYGGLLLDPAIFPEIREDMPKLFGIQRSTGRAGARAYHQSALWWAMDKGQAGAIGAYHRILARPAILECLKDSLPALVTGKDPLGRVTALYSALDKGYAPAIDAYHDLVADPVLLPFIRHVLPKSLRAEGEWGAPGLAMAMKKGYAQAVVSYHAMLADDAILPFIGRSLPGLVQARPWGEPAGVAQAVAAGHTQVVTAFHALLVDPKILSAIVHALPHLLVAKNISGAAGLPAAAREGYVGTVAAYRAILLDTRIEPYIEGRIRRRLSRATASGAMRPVPAMPKPATPAHAGSAWEAQVDQWLALHTEGRPPRPGFIARMALRVQQWAAA
ncbi:hypothetical protein AKI39_04480 [Bordetella sp. H567]|uniref:hypothetical protein n=1 Tax=Bordetella sp. H567 TaxID=1697043 RepID=UPI00081C5404|nr:hypothetical protein [Bordetella sp. H567]AOB30105.1 hypothetical protein AKI39_04480 [Bordetella sp. H567]